MNEKTVLAIDPGTAKCGMAVVTRNSAEQIELVWRKIAPVEQFTAALDEAKAARPFEMIILGGGTNSREIVQKIRDYAGGIAILVVDEKDTTLHARERYWVNTKRRGWRRLLPATLQVPPEPVDDYVALILAERVLLG